MWAYLILLLFSVGNAIGGHIDRLEMADVRVYANESAVYGEETSMVVTLAAFPDRKLILRIFTPLYMVLYCEFGIGAEKMEPIFADTTDIEQELNSIGIIPSTEVAYKTGFFAVIKATFWKPKKMTLKISATDPRKPKQPVNTSLIIDIRSPHDCIPNLRVHRCYDPEKPMEINIDETLRLRCSFKETCGVHNPTLDFDIYNVLGTKLLKANPKENVEFPLKRYTMRFKPQFELWRNLYLILITGVHQDVKYAAHCYLKVVPTKVEAIISGGDTRFAYYGDKIIMDGSMSRDYSKQTHEKQFDVYNWNCESYDDMHNKVCKKKISKDPIFTIPSNSLRVGDSYEFTLVVRSDFDPARTARTWQHIMVVENKVLYVDIKCVANCNNALYNPKNKVLLKAICYNCDTGKIKYEWFLNGKSTAQAKNLIMFIQADRPSVNIKLEVRTDNEHFGSVTKILTKNIPPRHGYCNVTPKVGVEFKTDFFVCCANYQSKNQPIKYFFYAGRVLLNYCRKCDCAIYLPFHLTSIKVLVCDNLYTCRTTYVSVRVTALPNTTVESPEALWNFMINPPISLIERAEERRSLPIHQLLASLAVRISSADLASVLMDGYDLINSGSLPSLGKLANFTHTLAERMTPINEEKQQILIRSVTKLNWIFDSVIRHEFQHLLVKEPYVNVTVACATVYKIMEKLNKHIIRPPQNIFDKYHKALKSNKLNQTVVDQLMEEISAFSNEEAKQRSMLWLNSTWQTERLYRYLYLARKHGIQADSSGVTAGVTLELKCFQIEKDRSYTIATSDRMHEVTFSPELLQETKGESNQICIKVISIVRVLHWWYPEEKQPSAIILSVRIFEKDDDFENEIKLHDSKLAYQTVIGKYKPAVVDPTKDVNKAMLTRRRRAINISNIYYQSDYRVTPTVDDEENDDFIAETGKYVNCLRNDSLVTMNEVRIYRMALDDESMLVVRFTYNTHKLQVLLMFDEPPKELRSTISKSGCTVPANSTNSTMLLRNNCMAASRVYLAVTVHPDVSSSKAFDPPVPMGPANYSFVFQVRSCDYWVYSKPTDEQYWSHSHCLPGLEFPKRGTMHCTCAVLGTYTSYVYYVLPIPVPTSGYVPVMINWMLVLIYIIFIVLVMACIVLLFLFYNKRASKTVKCDMTGLEFSEDSEVHDVLVTLKTGGRDNAQTTATVRLVFETISRTELQFTLMQDPERPELTRNSTYIIWLRTRDIRIPTRVAVAHNNAGRYPSWYLRSIEVADLQANLKQVFIVNHWVHHKFLVLSSAMVLKPGDKYDKGSWRARFATEFERQWVNWGLLQPLTGMWREHATHDSLTRAERVCIFLNKIMVTYCVCACYLGPTTPETAYADRGKIIKYQDLIQMFLISAVLTNLVQFVLEKIIIYKIKL